MPENNGLQGDASPAAEATLRADSERDVFVSYASQDAELANAIVLALEKSGLTCWIAPRDVVPGDLYADGIIRAITGSKVFVLVLSRDAIASNHVGKEVERASSKRRPIVAIRTDTTPLTPSLEYFLSESQWIELRAGQTDAALHKVVDAVRRQRGVEPVKASAYAEPTSSLTPKRLWLGGLALVALLVAVAAYFIVDRFRAAGHESQSLSVTTSLPAVHMPGLSAPVISEKSVAVLPFVDMSEKKDQEYFSDGLSEEIIDRLAHAANLKVIARTSSFQFKGKSDDVRTIGQKLGAANLLEGTVRRSGNSIRITAQLISVADGSPRWSETYDRQLTELFAIQDEITNKVVTQLKAVLATASDDAASKTWDPETYNEVLRSRYFRAKETKEDNNQAVSAAQRAIAIDPSYAPAWLALAQSYNQMGVNGWALPTKAYADARKAVDRALALDPRLAKAYFVRGELYSNFLYDFKADRAEVKHAYEIDPHLSEIAYSNAQDDLIDGHLDRAVAEFRPIVEADPLDTGLLLNFQYALYAANRLPEAEQVAREAFEINPNISWAHSALATILLENHRPNEALEQARKEPDEAGRLSALADTLWALGRRSEANTYLMLMQTKYADTDAMEIAESYALRGDLDNAFKWLNRAYENRDSVLINLRNDPAFRKLRGDRRFSELVARMHFPESEP